MSTGKVHSIAAIIAAIAMSLVVGVAIFLFGWAQGIDAQIDALGTCEPVNCYKLGILDPKPYMTCEICTADTLTMGSKDKVTIITE